MHTYERIAQVLAAEIDDGTWQPGELLPRIPELEKRFNASRITVRQGIEQLANRGYVYTGYTQGRRGTIVRQRGRTDIYANMAIRADRRASGEDAFTEIAHRAGRNPKKVFERRVEIPPADIAARLGGDPTQPVIVREIRQMLNDEPWSIETSYYPRDLAEEVGLDVEHDLPQGTIRALKTAGHEEIAHLDEVFDDTADADEAQVLAIPVGSPLIVQIRTAATKKRITRVTKYLRLGQRNRLLWEQGDRSALDIIESTRKDTKEL
ncbi:GntR family transcriptional regulator [Amycolatopsis eburnea]|uniref:GntR family transcriptional regulator n=1 Tax=Amycolatopsis eburnea TaxID=2267691 RepID=A0A3R9EZ61_9PSEU|nr:GntR family transcriptional regulator [Amycolatopsis eburnea]RSD26440.1 GntR family transcriptional regulator [Amycolatopsis eburnea]